MNRYFDSCATTAVDKEVIEAMNKALAEEFYNPSSPYSASADIRSKISIARQKVADAVICEKEEIVFTSGGTEANNAAIFGGLSAKKGKIITSRAEHPSIYNCIQELAKKGYEVVYTPLNADGSVNIEGFSGIADENTVLVALMHVNNETGAISDVKSLCKIAKSKNASCVFVCDGVQAFCKISVNLVDLNVDFYTASAHKIHGPKGIGALYIKKGAKFSPLFFGGSQEGNLRAGTENVAAVYGFGKAAEIGHALIKKNAVKFLEYKKVVSDYLNGHCGEYFQIAPDNSAPQILALAFGGVKSQILINLMEQKGFFVGSGSACSTKSVYSRVGQAINLPLRYIEGIVRICFSKHNSMQDVVSLAEELAAAVSEVRKMTK